MPAGTRSSGVRGYQGAGTRIAARSTGKNEPHGLSTRQWVKRRIATVIGTGPADLDHGSLHPQRPSGRSPHRPLPFLAAIFEPPCPALHPRTPAPTTLA